LHCDLSSTLFCNLMPSPPTYTLSLHDALPISSRSILPMTVSVYVLMVRSSEVSSCRILLYVSSSQATPSCSQVGYMRCRVFFIRSVSVFMLSRAFFSSEIGRAHV